MRVTKVIKDYVEREINAKFDKKLNEIGKDYRAAQEELDRRLSELCERTEAEAAEIAKSLGFDYSKRRYGSQRAVSISAYGFENEEKRKEIDEQRRALDAQCKNAIESILLSLELGETTKAELKSAIDSVTVE